MSTTSADTRSERKPENRVDIQEHGLLPDGSRSSTDRRLFMQLAVFTDCHDAQAVAKKVEASGIEAVVYLDVNDPRGIGLLALSEDPARFVSAVRPLLNEAPFRSLRYRPEFAMLGRTYASGYEPNVEDWLLGRPRRNVLDPEWPWAIWYPLRRIGAFNALPDEEQKSILREHGGIGRLYGEQGLAHDIRLACFGMDTNDNEFVIGLVGRDLHPLSHLVQRMRKTRQTSEFMERMGPFFVGHALFRSPR
ncbi:MAG TPA: chlorite dismutase family protein [Vicinamibacteria bacterium]